MKHTERSMLDALGRRYGQRYGNGDRWVCAEHVRNRAGHMATRTADLIVQDMWPSKGMEVHGHEVKVTRSDWLTELKDPTKAEAFRRYCHRWWLAVPDRKIVRDDLPAGWGLLVLREDGTFHTAVPAPRLQPEPMPRSMQVSIWRAVAKTSSAGRDLQPVRRVAGERRWQLVERSMKLRDDPRAVSELTWGITALAAVLDACEGVAARELPAMPEPAPEMEPAGLFEVAS